LRFFHLDEHTNKYSSLNNVLLSISFETCFGLSSANSKAPDFNL